MIALTDVHDRDPGREAVRGAGWNDGGARAGEDGVPGLFDGDTDSTEPLFLTSSVSMRLLPSRW